MDVSENNGTPKSSILIGFFNYKPSILGVPLFLETPIFIYIYISGTQMTLVLIGKDLVWGGLTFKNRSHLGSRYIYVYISLRIPSQSVTGS